MLIKRTNVPQYAVAYEWKTGNDPTDVFWTSFLGVMNPGEPSYRVVSGVLETNSVDSGWRPVEVGEYVRWDLAGSWAPALSFKELVLEFEIVSL